MKSKYLSVLSMLLICSCSSNQSQVIENKYNYDLSDETYSIVFKDHNGSVISRYSLKHEQEIIAPPNPIKENTPRYEYVFLGWDINSDGIVDELPVLAVSSFVAIAIYQYNILPYSVTFNVDCEQYIGSLNQNVDFGSSATAPTNLVKDGYFFVGWDNSFDYITSTTVVNAIWEVAKYNITLSYDYNLCNIDGYTTYSIQTGYSFFKRLPTPNKFLRSHYFTGWMYEDEIISDEMGNLFKPLILDSDITLTTNLVVYDRTGTYSFGYQIQDEVTDDALIEQLNDFYSTHNIEYKNFYYQDNLYWKEQDTFYTSKKCEYYYVDDYDEDGGKVGGEEYRGFFMSKEILCYDTAENMGSVFEYMTGTEYQNFDIKFNLPFRYTALPDGAMFPYFYDSYGDYEEYEFYYENIVISKYAMSLGASESEFIIADSNNTRFEPFKVLTSSGVDKDIVSGQKYGYRAAFILSTGLEGRYYD